MDDASNAKKSPSEVRNSEGLSKDTVVGVGGLLRERGVLFADELVNAGGIGVRAVVPDARAAGAGTTPAALLHQNSNNSPKGAPKAGYKLRSSAIVYKGEIGRAVQARLYVTDRSSEGVDREGRAWQLGDDGETWQRMVGGITSGEAKRAYALRTNVEAFTKHYRHENCGFLTITGEERTITPKEFGRAWDDMRKNRLKWLRGYVRVLEPQKRGTPHYHVCAATCYDLKPASFDWEALKGSYEARKAGDLVKARELTKKYAASATQELRDIWSELREACYHYGLGRSEMLPFRKEAGAVAHYIGKYLEGGLVYRRDDWRGARRVEYDRKESRQWKSCASGFSFVSPGSKLWRERVGELARAVGATTPEALSKKLGPRWAYHARPSIITEDPSNWRKLLAYWASEYGGAVDRKAVCTVGGEVVAWNPSFHENPECWRIYSEQLPHGFDPTEVA